MKSGLMWNAVNEVAETLRAVGPWFSKKLKKFAVK
jgi:hypothetical protein